MTTPASLKYSEAFKPVSVPSQVATAKFLPTTSQPYNPNNNVVRIPLNSNSFLDLRNLALKFKIKNNASGAPMFLDGNAGSLIQQLNVIGPDGAYLSQVQNYNRMYNGLCDVEKSMDVLGSVYNLLEGASNRNCRIWLQNVLSATANQIAVYMNDTLMGTLILGSGVTTVRAGEYTFGTTATAGYFTVTHRDTSINVTVGTTAGGASINGNTFTVGTTNTLVVNGVSLLIDGTVGGRQGMIEDSCNNSKSAFVQSEVIANNASTTYCVNLVAPITRLPVHWPAGHVTGGGVQLELFLAPADQVMFSPIPTTAPIYEATDFEAIVPVINYSEAVNMAFKSMLQQMGSVTMSSTDYQSFVIPVTNNFGTVSAPLAFRYRSLKSILFFFNATQSATDYTVPRVSARQFPSSNTLQFQLRVGSSLFPRQPVSISASNFAESVTELQKSVSKFGSIIHGSALDKDVYGLTQAQGGKFICGLDLESDQAFIEAGLNTQENGLSAILEIQGGDNMPAGNIFVYACYDTSISLLANGNVVALR
jgi:hypothetical protein